MYLKPCSDEQRNSIFSEINATDESLNENIDNLIQYMREQPNLPEVTDRAFLLQFLLWSKNNFDKAKSRLELYYENRISMAEVYKNCDPNATEIEDVINTMGAIPMPDLTPEGYRVLVCSLYNDRKAEPLKINTVLQCLRINCDTLLKFDQHKGIIVVYDLQNLTFDIIKLMFKIMNKLMKMFTRVTPFRYHKLYVLNLMTAARPLFYFGKALAPKKIADRIEIWSKPEEELSTVIPEHCLPAEYGGSLKSILQLRDDWFNFFKENAAWLEEEEEQMKQFW